jgi:hypothetical protein
MARPTPANWLRARAILIGREVKDLFLVDGQLRRSGEHVLADLRKFCHADARARPLFDSDPLVMARRIGRREVFDRLVNFLNLDEGQVQQLMELDDGIG